VSGSVHSSLPGVGGAIVRDIGTNDSSSLLHGASSGPPMGMGLTYINIYNDLTTRNIPVSPFMAYWTLSELVRYQTKTHPQIRGRT
jgi:hypothetical protein